MAMLVITRWYIPILPILPSSPRHESMAIGGLCHAAANLLGPEDVFVNTMTLSCLVVSWG